MADKKTIGPKLQRAIDEMEAWEKWDERKRHDKKFLPICEVIQPFVRSLLPPNLPPSELTITIRIRQFSSDDLASVEVTYDYDDYS